MALCPDNVQISLFLTRGERNEHISEECRAVFIDHIDTENVNYFC
jgi:hypothetical protein